MRPDISRFLVGVGVMLFGLVICAIALDFIRLAPGSIHAPKFVVLLTGLALVFIGSSMTMWRAGIAAYLYFSAFAL
jgi:hypothetical protein